MAQPWTITSLLTSLRDYLAGRGIPTARLDAELLLAHVLRQPRIYLYTHFDQPVTEDERQRLRALTVRRAAHEPMAYILGEQEFYGHVLQVDRRVLIPRPETEHLVEAACRYLAGLTQPVSQHADTMVVGSAAGRSSAKFRVLDIGTGSGALAIAIALAEPRAHVVAIDISEDALAVAANNVAKHGLCERVVLLRADVAALANAKFDANVLPMSDARKPKTTTDESQRAAFLQAAGMPMLLAVAPFDVIVSNPPYIGHQERADLPPSVIAYEPALALFAEEGGSALLRAVARLAPTLLGPRGLLAMELAPAQVQATQQACNDWAQTRIECDLAGHQRVCLAWRGEWVEARQQNMVQKKLENEQAL